MNNVDVDLDNADLLSDINAVSIQEAYEKLMLFSEQTLYGIALSRKTLINIADDIKCKHYRDGNQCGLVNGVKFIIDEKLGGYVRPLLSEVEFNEYIKEMNNE